MADMWSFYRILLQFYVKTDLFRDIESVPEQFGTTSTVCVFVDLTPARFLWFSCSLMVITCFVADSASKIYAEYLSPALPLS